MVASTARVATRRPTLYLKQLCEHFADERRRHSAQEFDVTFDEHEGFIDFAHVVSGNCRLDARHGVCWSSKQVGPTRLRSIGSSES
jgi:hypothetical protein